MWKLRYAVLMSLLRASNRLDGKASRATVPALKLSRISFQSFSLYLSFYVSWFSNANKNGGLPSGGSCACYTYRDGASRQQLAVRVRVTPNIMRFPDHHEISYLTPRGAKK